MIKNPFDTALEKHLDYLKLLYIKKIAGPLPLWYSLLCPGLLQNNQGRPLGQLKNLLCAFIFAAAAAGFVRYYFRSVQ